jgi:MSHA biogenesis protein MshL
MSVWRPLGIVLGVSLLAVLGCQSATQRATVSAPPPSEAATAVGAESAQASVPVSLDDVPKAVNDAMLPPLLSPGNSNRRGGDDRFDLNVNELDAQLFFMALVEGTPYNMVVHPEVSGAITLNLKHVTVTEIMNTVREVYGYEFRRVGNVFQVLPQRLTTRVFPVNYLNVKRAGHSETRVSAGQVSESGSSSSGGGGSDSSSGDSGGSSGGSASGEGGSSGSEIKTQVTADFWTELESTLKLLVGEGEGRAVVVSPQSGVVVVRAMPAEMRIVEEYLDTAQVNLHKQVVLEAKILEVQLADGFQSGVNWAAVGPAGNSKNFKLGQIGGGTLLGSGASDVAGESGDINPANPDPFVTTRTSAFGGIFTMAVEIDDFTAFIELLETQGKVQVLSSPRVLTLNNQKAVIKVGSDEFFVTDVSSTTVSGSTTTTSPSITLTPFFSGIALDVTPQIDAEGIVTLHVHPTVSEVKDQQKQISVGGSQQSLPLAFSTIRESDSMVRARSGQVVVIGGLMKSESSDAQASVPVLGKLPMVGSLFQHNKKQGSKSELVILLRPIVTDVDYDNTVELEAASQRFQTLDDEYTRQQQLGPSAEPLLKPSSGLQR